MRFPIPAPSGPEPRPFEPNPNTPFKPGWTRERNEPNPVAPDAAPGAAPVYRPGTPTK